MIIGGFKCEKEKNAGVVDGSDAVYIVTSADGGSGDGIGRGRLSVSGSRR